MDNTKKSSATVWQAIYYKEQQRQLRLATGIDRMATDEMLDLVFEIADRKEKIKALENEISNLSNKLKNLIDDGKLERILIEKDGKLYAAASLRNPSPHLDTEKLKKEAPTVYHAFLKPVDTSKRILCTYGTNLRALE